MSRDKSRSARIALLLNPGFPPFYHKTLTKGVREGMLE
jgi:hypothetical protein